MSEGLSASLRLLRPQEAGEGPPMSRERFVAICCAFGDGQLSSLAYAFRAFTGAVAKERSKVRPPDPERVDSEDAWLAIVSAFEREWERANLSMPYAIHSSAFMASWSFFESRLSAFLKLAAKEAGLATVSIRSRDGSSFFRKADNYWKGHLGFRKTLFGERSEWAHIRIHYRIRNICAHQNGQLMDHDDPSATQEALQETLVGVGVAEDCLRFYPTASGEAFDGVRDTLRRVYERYFDDTQEMGKSFPSTPPARPTT